MLRISASTYSQPIGANGPTIAKLISLGLFFVVSGQVFLFQLLLSEKARFHCPLCRIGFRFQQFFEPVDICLDDPSHFKLRISPFTHCAPLWRRSRSICLVTHILGQQGSPFACRCLLWVINRHGDKSTRCPLYPRKRTCAVQLGMSAKCQ